MKKFIGNTALKILAVSLSFVVFFTMIISIVGSAIMLFSDFYTRDFSTLEESVMNDLARSEYNKLVSLYDSGDSAVASYYEDKNILYYIEDTHSGEIVSNFKNQDYITSFSNSEFIRKYVGGESSDLVYDRDEVKYDYDTDQYYFYSENQPLYETNHKVEFTIFIPRNMQFTDRFFITDKIISFGYHNRYTFIIFAVISLVLSIVIYSYLFISVGHRNNQADIKVAPFNNIPIDVLSVIVLFVYYCAMLFFSEYYTLVEIIVFCFIVPAILYFVTLWYLMSFVVQLKAKTIFKHTFIYWLIKKISKFGNVIKHIYKNLKTTYKVLFVIGIFWSFILIFMGVNVYDNKNLILGFIFISAVETLIIIFCAIAFQRVKQGGEKIVSGDLENKIDTTYMFGDIKDFADSLNNINLGLQSAIDDKMKSERFKTELITNVSHDIKTPLTSIVNYVDLIKKEECENEKIKEYIDVLDRQSIRLKKLIEDLVEASKASTGNLSVELEKCNLSLLMNQAIGEFYEKLELNNLQVIQSQENQDVYIMADGRRLWRVIDNLLNNICKYAMSGTRVYIDLKRKNGKAIVTFRNISNTPINLSSEELTERFVRGDRSRNTEGSGLGLSIAKSLTELQGGSFAVSADGDLFKVVLSFGIIN
ncbi:MAG: HAMP domain-containing histidine kinase [Clostridia bacterium]|nr:HAMP domain-containing histidine kinase [Clostridia bacterium]MBR3591439.1 HAMP domain-containing histidine kinase [Clostridia bacterium]